MNFKALALVGALAIASVAGAAQAAVSFENGSFENGFDPWIVSNSMLVGTAFDANHFDADGNIDNPTSGAFAPIHGDVFAVLTTGAEDEFVTIRQTFSTAGGLFTGFAAFLGGDYIDPQGIEFQPAGSFNDYGYVRVFGAGGAEVFFSSIADVGNFGRSDDMGRGDGWTPISLMLASGNYTIEAGVVNIGDGRNDSRLLLDAFSVPPAAVPEPATWAMMILGFFGLGALVRRRQAALA